MVDRAIQGIELHVHGKWQARGTEKKAKNWLIDTVWQSLASRAGRIQSLDLNRPCDMWKCCLNMKHPAWCFYPHIFFIAQSQNYESGYNLVEFELSKIDGSKMKERHDIVKDK